MKSRDRPNARVSAAAARDRTGPPTAANAWETAIRFSPWTGVTKQSGNMGDTFAPDFEATGCLPAAHHPLVRSLDQVVAIRSNMFEHLPGFVVS